MEEEYYTPTIEEFHVGFEYEALNKDDTWEQYKCGKSFKHSYQISDGSKHKIRVKYLDKEDIESFGFEMFDESPSPFTSKPLYKFKYTHEAWINTGSNYILISRDKSILIQIDTYGSYDTHSYRMEFWAKNKSELAKILKQIGYKDY